MNSPKSTNYLPPRIHPSARPILRHLVPLLLVGACLLPFDVSANLAAQTAVQEKGDKKNTPMQAQAQRAAQGPMKLDVRPLTQGARVDSKVTVEISLRDAANRPSVSDRQSQVELEIVGRAGKSTKHTVIIPAGQSAVQFTFEPVDAGLLSLKVRETNGTLLPGGNSVLVNRSQTLKKISDTAPRAFQPGSTSAAVHLLGVTAQHWDRPVMLPALHWTEQDRGGAPETAIPSSSRELLLTNSSGRDEILADGKDFARIQVHFMDPQGAAAPSDIKVWLTWSNGKLDPQPLVIKKGEFYGEAQWTSRSPVDATGSVVATAPLYSVNGGTAFRVSFVPPIYGIGMSSESPLKLSLIDRAPVIAQFFDDRGRTIETSKTRRVTFVSSNPALHADPSERLVKPNESTASILLWATWFGQSTIDIWTPGYAKQTIVVDVTIWFVLALCVGFGIVGSIASVFSTKKTTLKEWPKRIVVGIAAAIVVVSLQMFAISSITGTLSVVGFSLLAGYGGALVLDKALGLVGRPV
jgi:hypothetical protein